MATEAQYVLFMNCSFMLTLSCSNDRISVGANEEIVYRQLYLQDIKEVALDVTPTDQISSQRSIIQALAVIYLCNIEPCCIP